MRSVHSNTGLGNRRGGAPSLLRGLGAAFAIALLAATFAAPSRADDSDLKARYNMGDPIAADAVAKNPDLFYGKKIFVEGEVDDILGAGLVEIEKMTRTEEIDGFESHGHDLLVLLPSGVPSTAIAKDRDILLVGVLQQGLPTGAPFAGDHDYSDRPVLVVEAAEVK